MEEVNRGRRVVLCLNPTKNKEFLGFFWIVFDFSKRNQQRRERYEVLKWHNGSNSAFYSDPRKRTIENHNLGFPLAIEFFPKYVIENP